MPKNRKEHIAMSKQDFLSKVIPGAQKTYEKYGVFPSVVIAQAIHESGWGGSRLARVGFNLFGVKFPGAHDPSLKITRGSWATDDGGYYAYYQNWGDSIMDHGYFLKNNPRYTKYGVFSAKTPFEQIKAIRAAGYASDPNYVSKVTAIMKDNNLTQYDKGTYVPGATANASVGSAEQVEMMTIEETNYQVVKGSEKRGDILFGRRYRITVSDESGTAIDISRLHCTFSIIKTIQMEPNSSEISVYNLNAQTENAIIMNGKRVTVEAGYEGSQFGLIFDGDIIQCIREKVNANTFKLTIIALDSDRAINFDIANYSILRGQSHRSIVEHIANKASNPVPLGSISEKLKNTTLPRGKVLFGKASDFIRQIAKSNGLKCYMDDGRLNLIDLKELPKNEIFKLDPTSGLIGVPEQTQYGVSGQCLLNPQIKLNSLIHIDNSLIRDKRIEFGTSSAVPASVSTGDSGASTGTSGGQPSAGGYLIPYNGNFKITSHFGRRGGTNHNGIDLGMPIGTPIFASKAGKVLKAGVDSKGINYGGGKIIMLEHPDGTATNYFHLNDWSVKTGDNVRQGQQIGLSGNTGGSTGPHLHFEIKEGGKYKDPIFVINGSGGNSAPPSVASANASVGGSNPSSSSGASAGDSGEVQSMIRSLDKDGIYRVIKMEYVGDTRGNEWHLNFETITQLGGAIPIVPV